MTGEASPTSLGTAARVEGPAVDALAPFLGRAVELDELRGVLAEHRLVTLTGAGGVGKTRLALEASRSVERPVRLVELASAEASDVARVVRASTGAFEHPDLDEVGSVVAWLDEHPSLVVLDNCEHVLDEVGVVVDAILAGAPASSVLATSRAPLGRSAEVVWRVPPLLTPAVGTDRDLVGSHDAVQLFVDRARRLDRRFVLAPANVDSVAEVVRSLEGMPLAIELAAAQVRVLGVEQVLALADGRLRGLPAARRDVDERHRSLDASIWWSWDLLDERSQIVLRRASVFAGGFSLAAAEAVVGDDLVARSEVLPALAALADSSMVSVVECADGSKRFTVLETIRQFAADRLADAREGLDLEDRHLRWFASQAAAAEPALVGAAQLATLDEVERDLPNIRKALAWSRSTDPDAGLAIAADLDTFWKLRGRVAEGIEWLSGADATEDPALSRRARFALCDLLFWSGREVARSYEIAEELLADALAAGDDWIAGRAAWELGNHETATSIALGKVRSAQAIELTRRSGDDWCLCVSLQIGLVSWYLEPECFAMLDEAVAIAQRLGCPQLEAWMWMWRARVAWDLGDVETADEGWERGLPLAEAIGDPATMVFLAASRVETLTARGRATEALDLGRGYVRFATERGATTFLPLLQLFVDLAAQAVGEPPLPPLPDPDDTRLGGLKLFADLAGEPTADEVAGALRDNLVGLELARANGHPPLIVSQLLICALLSLPDDLVGAETMIHEALTEAHRLSILIRLGDAFEALAVTAALRGADLDAARFLGVAGALKTPRGIGTHPAVARLGHVVADAAQRCGPDAWAAALREGAALDVDDAMAHARRNRGKRGRPSSGWASLTPAELRVVALVEEGLTNPQIAERLFVSRGTVKTHLSNIFAKLGVSTRAALVSVAANQRAS